MAFAFESPHVYQKAVSFADAACTLTKDSPRGRSFLADRLNRAAQFEQDLKSGSGRAFAAKHFR